MTHILTAIVSFVAGWNAPPVLTFLRRWWNPAKCEICGGVPYAVHGRARIGDDGEMGEPQFVVLCEACHVENEAAIRQELEGRE